MSEILIIKHGALGDMILATGPMQAIREQHPKARITLLTQPGFAAMMKKCPFVNDVWTDSRPKLWRIGKFLGLVSTLRSKQFDWVYDLQTSSRSSLYHRFIKHTHWSGIARGASHRHNTPHRTRSHTIDRQKEQLAIAGINNVPPPDIRWMQEGVTEDELPGTKFILLVPGGSAHRPEKRWPAEHFIRLSELLIEEGYTPVLIGSDAEKLLLKEIARSNKRIVNLCGKTNLGQITTLGFYADYALGNDTGPMHIIAATGCACSVLFNLNASNPDLCAPRGEDVKIFAVKNLESLYPELIMPVIHEALSDKKN